jgi:hypothetical protein
MTVSLWCPHPGQEVHELLDRVQVSMRHRLAGREAQYRPALIQLRNPFLDAELLAAGHGISVLLDSS